MDHVRGLMEMNKLFDEKLFRHLKMVNVHLTGRAGKPRRTTVVFEFEHMVGKWKMWASQRRNGIGNFVTLSSIGFVWMRCEKNCNVFEWRQRWHGGNGNSSSLVKSSLSRVHRVFDNRLLIHSLLGECLRMARMVCSQSFCYIPYTFEFSILNILWLRFLFGSHWIYSCGKRGLVLFGLEIGLILVGIYFVIIRVYLLEE